MRTIRRAFIGLGSNLGDKMGYLRQGVEGLRLAGDVVGVSPVYETAPVGGPQDQDSYLNVVVELSTSDAPHTLLDRCRALEEAAMRVRTVRFGPRTLDADVLYIDGESLDDEDLIVPHPRMWERRFVLAPLRDLAPKLVDDAVFDASQGEVRVVGMLSPSPS